MSTARFQLFRPSLSRREQADLFEAAAVSREQYLRDVFAEEYQFEHYGSTFHYIPDAARGALHAILGRIGRPTLVEENLPPDRGLVETIHDRWKAAVIAIDPGDHADGQKASVEIDPQVGTPLIILSNLANAINSAHPASRYLAVVQPIVNAESFWDFARKHQGEITSITFEFVTPNGLWSTDSSLREELQQVRHHIKAEKVTTKFMSQDGLDTND